MEPATPLRLTASAIQAYVRCPYRFAREHVERLPEAQRAPVPALAFGNAIHRALAQFIRRGGWVTCTLDDVVGLLLRYWEPSAFADEAIANDEFMRAREMVEAAYCQPYPRAVAVELGVERFVAWPGYRRGILLSGRFDRVVRLPSGAVEVIDLKCSRPRGEPEDLERDVQAIVYRTLAASAFERGRPERVLITLLYLDGVVPHTIEFDHDDFAAAWARIEETANAIRRDRRYHVRGLPLDEAFPRRRGDQCRGCPMRLHCERQLALAAEFVPGGCEKGGP